jgi:hypothetical protein
LLPILSASSVAALIQIPATKNEIITLARNRESIKKNLFIHDYLIGDCSYRKVKLFSFNNYNIHFE